MRPYFTEYFGNASSLHQHGLRVRDALKRARQQMAALIGADSEEEIYFTSDGTESSNLAIKGAAYANERKGKVNFASFGTGSSSHIWGEMLNQAEKLDMTHVPYKGAAPAIQDTLAGHIPMTIQDLAAGGPSIMAGKLTPIAITSAQRWPRLPDVPTFKEAGYDIALSGWNAILAPAGTPPEIVERMSSEIRKLVQTPEGKERLLDMGLIATGTTSAELTKIMKTGCAAWADAVKRAGVEPE